VLAVDAGGVYVVSNGASIGSPALVRKYGKDGDELWTRRFEMWNSAPAVASDGSTVYVGGINPPGVSGLIRMYDVDGNELSTHVLRFGEIQTGVQDFAVGCVGVFAAGHTSSSTFVSRPIDTFVIKLSSPALPWHPDAPTVSATSPLVVVNAGQVGRNSGIHANPGTNQPVSLSASVGTLTKTGIQEGSWEWSFNTTDGPDQSQVVTITADDGQGGISTALFGLIVNVVTDAGAEELTSLNPAKIWVGLKNSDAVGLRLDLKTEVFVNQIKVGEGQLNNVTSGSSGFNNAKLNTIPLTLFAPVEVPANAALKITLSVRRTCFGGGHNSGTSRLWYNDSQANSRFGATIGDTTSDLFLRSGFALATSPGSGPKQTIDVGVDNKASCPNRPFIPFGTWNLILP
jgi:hypothetical protein